MTTTLCHVTFSTIDALPPLLSELKSLSESNVRTFVLGLKYDHDLKSYEEMHPNIHVFRMELLSRKMSSNQFWLLKLIRYIEFNIRVLIFLFQHEYNLVIAHDITALIPSYLASALLSKKLIYNAHEMWTERNDASTPFPQLWRTLDKYFCKRVDRIITPEINRSHIYQNEYGAKSLPLTIRNVPPYRASVPDHTKLFELLNVRYDTSNKIILYQGLFDESRCLLELIKAMRYIDQGKVLVLVGDGDNRYRSMMMQLVSELSLETKVFLLKKIPYDRLFEYTCSAHAGMLLYRNNGRNNYYCAPNKLYEYFRAGLPVIASNFPGLQSIIEANRIGYCVAPDEPEQIADAITRLFDSEDEYIQKKHRILELAKKEFNWEREFPILLNLYKQFGMNVTF